MLHAGPELRPGTLPWAACGSSSLVAACDYATQLPVRAGHSGGLPYHGQQGLNAGILLLSLVRLREANFGRDRDRIIRHFLPKKQLPLGDQVSSWQLSWPCSMSDCCASAVAMSHVHRFCGIACKCQRC